MKLSSLTQQDKIKLAAELDGFKPLIARDGTVYGCPSYDTSYDAIIPLIQEQSKEIKQKLTYILWKITGKKTEKMWDMILEATPSQLLDALLIATGKAEL